MEKDYSAKEYFHKQPEVQHIFDALAQKILERYPGAFTKVQKSQIAFSGSKPFCWAWLPIRGGIKGRPERYLILSFGLNREIEHPRLIGTVEPRPGRWMHHVIIGTIDEIDAEVMGWIDQAYHWKND